MRVRSTDQGEARAMRWWIAALLVAATILFVLGVTVERGTEAGDAPHLPLTPGLATPAPAAEGSEAAEAAEGMAAPVTTPTGVGEPARELVLGVDVENPVVVVAIVLGWAVLLGAVFVLGRNGLILLALAAGAATLFDLAEVSRQLNRANLTVTILAVAVTLAHLGLFGLVLWTLLRRHRPSVRPLT